MTAAIAMPAIAPVLMPVLEAALLVPPEVLFPEDPDPVPFVALNGGVIETM
jgi:hypothetical protein